MWHNEFIACMCLIGIVAMMIFLYFEKKRDNKNEKGEETDDSHEQV